MNWGSPKDPLVEAASAWRIFIDSLRLQALAIGLLATACAAALSAAAPATFTALDWSIYDTWLRHRTAIAVSPALTIVARDRESESLFGAGPWDRTVIAELVGAAHEAGATAIGVDHRLNYPSSAHQGGAAGDALLLEAIRSAGPVVFVYDPDTLLRSDQTILSHATLLADSDHVARSIPLHVILDGQTIPAFASALHDLHRGRTGTSAEPRPDQAASLLINPVGTGSGEFLPMVPLSLVWDALQHQDEARLQAWFKDKVVAILSQPTAQGSWLLPTGSFVTGLTAHLQLLNGLLTGNSFCTLGTVSRFSLTALFASFVAWCLLSFPGSTGLLLAGGGLALYGGAATALLSTAQVVMPVALPLTAALIVLAGTTAWSHLTAGQRVLLLERDMLRIRQEALAVTEALILRENRAEALEEDLEAAKAAIAASSDQQEALADAAASLRSQLVEVETQEQAARSRLEQLERRLHDLQAAGAEPLATLGDAELDRLREECLRQGIITQDPSLLRLYRDVKQGAKSPLTVLLLGEPGTGKELFARAVHRLSPRSSRTFLAVNMAAISPDLFESELFGHMKGSFTGASADRRGYFELADHGTIFLDEIGDLRPDHQSKLLRVLQEKSFYRVGAAVPTMVDVRIVAATNRDLQRGVSEGWFREDLYFRLKGLVFRLPPLRERLADIPLIAERALSEIAGQLGRSAPKLSNEALRLLCGYEWPGNVRELRHALERAVALNDGPVLTNAAFSLTGPLGDAYTDGVKAPVLPESAGDAAVLACLRQRGFDMQATAKALGWDRSTVTQRLKGLCFQALVESGGDQAKAAMAIAGASDHLRTVELKLKEYYTHLLSVIDPFKSADDALADCRRRFKNLPERHFSSVEALVHRHLSQAPPARTPTSTVP